MNPFIILFFAIVSEVIGTTALKASDDFSKLWPSLLVVVGYIAAFSLLSLTLKQIPLGIAYAIWSGVGTAATVGVGMVIWGEKMDIWKALGILLIIGGVVVLNFMSKTEVA